MTNSTLDNTEKLGITLPESTIERIGRQRVDIPRNRYIRRAIERYLKVSGKKQWLQK
jgi:hypothetical protein